MAVFQTRVKVVGAIQYTGDNSTEVAEFISKGIMGDFDSSIVDIVGVAGYWAVKDHKTVIWLSDDEFRERFQLSTQGKDENISDDYR